MAMRLYRLINILSLDIVAGAVTCSLFFHKAFNVKIDAVVLLVLGLSVWTIYSADHLLDARRLKNSASTMRHRFFQKHFKILVFTSLVCTLVVIALLPFISLKTLSLGMVLILIIIVYLIAQRYLVFAKEFIGSILYSAGVMLPALTSGSNLNIEHGALVIQFLIVAWINLLIFSIFDGETDRRDQHVSFVSRWGESKAERLIVVLFTLDSALFIYGITGPYFIQSLIIFVMGVLLIFIILFKSFFAQSDRFRLLGDAVFLLPLIVWL